MFQGDVADRLAIRELIERYSGAVMVLDAQAWKDCWAPDAVWRLRGAEIVGREAITATWSKAMAAFSGVTFLAVPGAITVEGGHGDRSDPYFRASAAERWRAQDAERRLPRSNGAGERRLALR